MVPALAQHWMRRSRPSVVLYEFQHPCRSWTLLKVWPHKLGLFPANSCTNFMYLVFTRMPADSFCRQLRSLLLCLCDIFWTLNNSLACWSHQLNQLFCLLCDFWSIQPDDETDWEKTWELNKFVLKYKTKQKKKTKALLHDTAFFLCFFFACRCSLNNCVCGHKETPLLVTYLLNFLLRIAFADTKNLRSMHKCDTTGQICFCNRCSLSPVRPVDKIHESHNTTTKAFFR